MPQISQPPPGTRPQISLAVTLFGLVLGVPTVHAQTTDWSTPATIIDSACVDPQHSSCNGKPLLHHFEVHWDKVNIKTRMVVPTANVRFGPFQVVKEVERRSGTHAVSSSFRVSVWARSPAVYVSGQYEGATQTLTKIGETAVVLNGEDSEEKTLYVTATLPSVFTAVQLRAQSSAFPADCGDLPESADNPATLDQPCLQVAVNPLAVLVPKVAPLAILYEGPGNCSWANLTHTHAAGADMTVQESTSTSSRTITDLTVLTAKVDHSDFTEEKVSSKERESKVVVSRSQSFGTQLGLPLESPGNPECNNPSASVPARQNSGLGQGDVFIFLYEPSLIYWNTADMSNFVFTDASAPGHPRHMFIVTAAQIAQGAGLPPGITFTDAEKNAILSLDPFTNPNWTVTNLPERLVFVNEIWSLSQGQAIQQNDSEKTMTAGRIKQAVSDAQAESQDNLDIPTKLVLTAFSFGGGAAVNAAVGAALGWMASQWPDPSAMGFDGLEKAVKEKGVSQLFTYTNETTVTTTYTRGKEIEKTDENAITQNFYIKDTNQGLNVALFYDALFGTLAFVPWPANMGVATSYSIRRLPVSSWSVATTHGGPIVEAMPRELLSSLAKVGGKQIVPVPAAKYVVSRQFTKGLPTSFQLNLSKGNLRGQIAMRKQRAQALFLVLNEKRKKVGQLWVNVDVNGGGRE